MNEEYKYYFDDIRNSKEAKEIEDLTKKLYETMHKNGCNEYEIKGCIQSIVECGLYRGFISTVLTAGE